MERSSRTPAQDPLLQQENGSSTKDRTRCITVFLLGMIAAGLFMIFVSLIFLAFKGKMEHQELTSTTTSPETTWIKGFVFEISDPKTGTKRKFKKIEDSESESESEDEDEYDFTDLEEHLDLKAAKKRKLRKTEGSEYEDDDEDSESVKYPQRKSKTVVSSEEYEDQDTKITTQNYSNWKAYSGFKWEKVDPETSSTTVPTTTVKPEESNSKSVSKRTIHASNWEAYSGFEWTDDSETTVTTTTVPTTVPTASEADEAVVLSRAVRTILKSNSEIEIPSAGTKRKFKKTEESEYEDEDEDSESVKYPQRKSRTFVYSEEYEDQETYPTQNTPQNYSNWKAYSGFKWEKMESSNNCSNRIIGYFNGSSSTPLKNSHFSKLTHAVFHHNFLASQETLTFRNNESQSRFEDFKVKSLGAKVMISIGGWEDFPKFVRHQKTMYALVSSIFTFLDDNDIDGVDLCWIWSEPDKDRLKYTRFVKMLREKLNDKIISFTFPNHGSVFMGSDLEEIIKHVDFVNMFTTDYYEPRDNETGPAAPLYGGWDGRIHSNVDYTMDRYVCWLKDPKKFNIVVPLDTQIWMNVMEAHTNSSEVFREAKTVDGKPYAKTLNSRKLAEEYGINFSNASWDETSKSSYILKNNSLTVFESEKSIEAKLDYVKEKHLGGVWIRNMDMDDGRSSLMDTVDFNRFCETGSENLMKYQC